MKECKTGRYIWDKETQTLIKISDQIPKISSDVTFKGPEEILDIDDKPVVVHSKLEKKMELRKRGLVEIQTEHYKKPPNKFVPDPKPLQRILEQL